ncbi:putative quinol monooxygenase [Variovorax sp. ZT4R33]|uniref:putative quinol monooxygenase n=1 Tax=Variovorax sp. ZT4R33 TaxID=3443743 RepID=UPI003F474E53
MIGMIVRINVKEGKSAEFERAFAVQGQSVRANELGNHLYELFQSRTQPDTYTLVELYDDDHALAVHKEAPHMVANRPLIEPLVEGRPVVEKFDIVPHETSA